MAKKKDINLDFLQLPYEPLELPSKGYFYEESVPEIKNGTINIRKMIAKDERLLDSINRLNFYNKWSSVIKNCTKENFDPFDLTLFDVFYIIYWLRAKTFGSKYEINTTCPHCNTEQSHYLDISNFPITYIEKKIQEPFNVELFNDGNSNIISVKIKYPRLGDIVESSKKNHSDLSKKGVRISETLYLRFLCTTEMTIPQNGNIEILNPEEHERLMLDIYEKLPADSLLNITDEYENYEHGIINNIDLQCIDCGELFPQLPLFTEDFFRPTKQTIREGNS
jgi:hypothetical protein